MKHPSTINFMLLINKLYVWNVSLQEIRVDLGDVQTEEGMQERFVILCALK